jgi:hypothetical protein
MEGYSLNLSPCWTFLFRTFLPYWTFLIWRVCCARRAFRCASHISATPSVCVVVTPGHDTGIDLERHFTDLAKHRMVCRPTRIAAYTDAKGSRFPFGSST